ncbi:MAG: L,D-transpeptidase family protein [Caulobacteraceae bacterium]
MSFRSTSRWIFVLAASTALCGNPKAFADPPPPPSAAPSEPSALRPDDVNLLRKALDQAGAQGLDPKALTPPGLDALLGSSDMAKRRRGESVLKAAVLRYARQVRSGRLDASDFDDEWALRPPAFDPKSGLEAALAQNGVAAWLASLPPPLPGYGQAVKQLAVYRDIAAKGGWARTPAGRKLEPGAPDKRVSALRVRLAIEDTSAPAAGPDVLDPPLVEALKAFQRRHGLPDDGTLGPGTIAALNVPVERRIVQIEANLERWRWLTDSLPADRVDVNIPAALTTLVKGGQVALEMRAAPGRKTDHTPMLQSTISGVVLNPPWNIPQSIAEAEILPKERDHPGYLQDEEIEVIDTPDGGRRLQQKAGPKSALGQVKFEFDNRFGVYLHDTPSKAAFDRTTRTVSHGCVRLEKPRELAAQLLEGQAGWSTEALAAAIDAGDTKRVALDRPMPVFLFYWTAYAGPDGRMIFYPDAYDWDAELLKKIADKGSSRA